MNKQNKNILLYKNLKDIGFTYKFIFYLLVIRT